jgi:hypothetical protein
MQNPDFRPPPHGIDAELRRMSRSPVGLARPLVVLAGWRAPLWPSLFLAQHLGRLAGDTSRRSVALAFTSCTSFDAAARRVPSLIDRLWPSSSPEHTAEVDIVGISMGGLIARAAAIHAAGRKYVRIARLFTLGTPHRGARIAPYIPWEPLVRGMRPGSVFLGSLDEHLPRAGYELRCYARLRDSWVGARNTAPPGREPFWKGGPPLFSHQTIAGDRLIRADIARCLRYESPLAQAPSAPPAN